MPSRVLYHCPCSTGFSPCIGPIIASSSLHPLPSLYFCEECDSIRCNLCSNNEVAIYYCPSCLFEVPAAGVKGEKSRCARNCFLCPVCTHTLSVSPSDLGGTRSKALQAQLDTDRRGGGNNGAQDDDDDNDWNPRTAQASIGEAPYYLVCSACKWDSQEVGMVFEKSTGLSLQVQRREDAAIDVVEFNQLRSHFEQFIKMNANQPISSTTTTTTTTIPLAARSSKLFRDVPSLANDPIFLPKRNKIFKEKKSEDLKPYVAASAWDAGRDKQKYMGIGQGLDQGKALGVIGRREQDRIDFLCEQEDEWNISGLMERWQSPADQSVRINDIRPSRVPLKTKQTKRCPACRHIIVKSDPKAQSSRFKIKLMALNYLPEIQIQSSAQGVSSMTAEDRRRSTVLLASRKREVGSRIDEEKLHSGRSYLFELAFTNPLDDAMTVQLHIAKHAGNSSLSNGQEQSSSPNKRDLSKADWTVTPTTSVFPISAFNEVWELDEEDNELLESVSKNSSTRGKQEGKQGEAIDEMDELSDEFIEENRNGRSDIGSTGERRRKKNDGILKRKGHETTIGLELTLSKEASGDIEVTYHYSPDLSEEHSSRSKREDTKKSFTFWTVVRLGKVSIDVGRTPTSGLPAMSTEARRSALDKRRSIMGINVNQSIGPSTLASLRESNRAKLPTDRAGNTEDDED